MRLRLLSDRKKRHQISTDVHTFLYSPPIFIRKKIDLDKIDSFSFHLTHPRHYSHISIPIHNNGYIFFLLSPSQYFVFGCLLWRFNVLKLLFIKNSLQQWRIPYGWVERRTAGDWKGNKCTHTKVNQSNFSFGCLSCEESAFCSFREAGKEIYSCVLNGERRRSANDEAEIWRDFYEARKVRKWDFSLLS